MSKSMKSFLHPTEGHYKEMMTDRQYDGLRIIENEFGLKGYAVFWKLVEKICGSAEGYCIEWDDRVGELFAADLRVNYSLVRDIVDRLISVGVFDERLFHDCGILTASFIQDNWTAVKKRSYEVKEAYRLDNCTQIQNSVCKKGQNASKRGTNASKGGTNAALTKLNLTELNLTDRQTAEDFSVVHLTDQEREELVRLSDSLSVDRYIKNLSHWQQQHRVISRKAFVTIKGFIEEDKPKRRVQAKRASDGNEGASYDIAGWQDFCENFDPSIIGGEK